MKVLILNSTNEYISTGQIANDLKNSCEKKGYDVLMLFGRGTPNSSNEIRISGKLELFFHVLMARLTGLQGYYSFFSTLKAKRAISKFNPDVVFVGNLHGYYLNFRQLLKFLKNKKIPVCLFMFDEYIFMGKCSFPDNCDGYMTGCGNCPRKKYYPKTFVFDRSRKILNDKINSFSEYPSLFINGFENSLDKLRKSLFYEKVGPKVLNVGWGIDLKCPFNVLKKEDVRKELKLPLNQKIFLAIAPLSFERKGIKQYYFEIAKKCESQNTLFLHIGNDLNYTDYPNNVISLPYISDKAVLAKYLCAADYFVITSKDEGYPTTCIYSLLCGTPIISFDSVYLGKNISKECVKYFLFGDIDSVVSFIMSEAVYKDISISKKCRFIAEEQFDIDNVISKILTGMGFKNV